MANIAPAASIDINGSAEAFNAQINVLATAAEQILKRLTPLLGTDNSLDGKITDTLSNVVERFVEAVKFTFMSGQQMSTGVIDVCSLLVTKSTPPPSIIRLRLKSITEVFYCGEANARDAMTGYSDLRRDVDEQFKNIISSYGPLAMIKISTKESVDSSSLQSLGDTILKHLEGSEKASSALVNALTAINQNLKAFLEDETFSIATPLSEAHLWSADMLATWNNLKKMFPRLIIELRKPIREYSSWHKWYDEDSIQIATADVAARLPQITLPSFKIQIPDDPPSSDPGHLSEPWVNGNLGGSQCAIRLEDVDQAKPSTSSVKVSVDLTLASTWLNYLRNIHIFFDVHGDGASTPTSFQNYCPRNAKDMSSDPSIQPQNCKPALRARISSKGQLRWTFNRPFFRWDSTAAFPTHFSLSFDLQHTSPVTLECYVVFVYKRTLTLILLRTRQLYGTQFIDQPPLSDNGATGTTTAPHKAEDVNDSVSNSLDDS